MRRRTHHTRYMLQTQTVSLVLRSNHRIFTTRDVLRRAHLDQGQATPAQIEKASDIALRLNEFTKGL